MKEIWEKYEKTSFNAKSIEYIFEEILAEIESRIIKDVEIKDIASARYQASMLIMRKLQGWEINNEQKNNN
jgi:hypothetical protein